MEILTEENSWLQVKLSDGRVGWVYGYYVDMPSSPDASSSLAGRVIAIDPVMVVVLLELVQETHSSSVR